MTQFPTDIFALILQPHLNSRSMIEEFEQYLRQGVPELTAAQMSYIRSISTIKKLRKRECLLHEGEVARCKIFVLHGLLRNYNIAEDGTEHIMRFTPEMNWTTDPDGFWNNLPSKYTIEAMEFSEVMLWTKDDFESIRSAIPEIGAFSESLITRNMSETQNRLLLSISGTPEEKYRYFVDAFPDVFARVPLHMIASYLGVSRETLTRVRQGLAMAGKSAV